MAEAQASSPLDEARQAGLSDGEIFKHLTETRKVDWSQIQEAQKAGVSNDEIINHITQNVSARTPGPRGAGESLAGGAIKGIASTLATAATVGTGPVGGAFKFATGKTIGEVAQPILEKGANKLLNVFGQRPLVYDKTSDLAAGDRPFAVGGEILGAAAVPIAGMETAAVRGGATLSKVLGSTFKQVSGATNAALAGGLAEAKFPGNPYAQGAAIVAGGGIQPLGVITRTVMGVASTLRGTAQAAFSQSAREGQAAARIKAAVIAGGGDPTAAADALELNAPAIAAKVRGTPGMLSGEPGIVALETDAAKNDPTFNQTQKVEEQGFYADLRAAIDSMTASGDPKLLAAAAALRKQHFDDLMTAQTRKSERAVVETNAKFGGVGSGAEAQRAASVEAYKTLSESVAKTDDIQQSLWSAVPKTVKADLAPFHASYAEATKDLLPGEKLPGLAADVAMSLVNPDAPVIKAQVGFLLRLRSRLGAQAQQEWGPNGNHDWARRLDILKTGIDNSLGTVQAPEAQAAITYTRARHDAFTRSLAGEVMSKNSQGALNVSPEALLNQAFSGRDSFPDVRLAALRDAAAFPNVASLYERMSGAQEQFLRGSARLLIDKATGKVDAQALAKFTQDHAAVLKPFPALQADLADAQSAQRALETATDRGALLESTRSKAAFAQLLPNATDDPVGAVGKLIANSKTVLADYLNLVRTAKRSGDGAVAGLRTATIESGLKGATDSGGLSYAKLNAAFNEPLRSGLPSRIELMVGNGVMSKDQAGRLNTLIQKGLKYENAKAAGVSLEELAGADAWTKVLARAGGAIGGAMFHHTVGQVLPIPSGSAGLVISGAFAKESQRLLDKVPNIRVQSIIQKGIDDPAFMAQLLRRPTTDKAINEWYNKTFSIMVNVGIIPDPKNMLPAISTAAVVPADTAQQQQPQ